MENTQTPKKKYPVNLPKTNFSMKANLPMQENHWLKFWQDMGLYEKLQKERAKAPLFVLHDGPPYANGPIHMGTALNKVLKDMVLRSRAMAGYRAPYVPGWDCHGLPIEQALLKELKISKKEAEKDPVGFRQKCRAFVYKMIELQRKDFMRLGGMGDWHQPYVTMEPPYAATILEAFIKLYQKGYIYRGKKSVFWCLHCETALAHAEIEYANKTSPSIYVAFEATSPSTRQNYCLVIWTTTPWTLPANRAVSVQPEARYAVLELSTGKKAIVLETLAEKLSALWLAKKTAETFLGQDLLNWKLKSPLALQTVPVIADPNVSLEEGTGLVHNAPGHGFEDYVLGMKYGLEIFSPVDERGCYTQEVPVPDFAGKRVIDAETAKALLRYLGDHLLYETTIKHSYAHCWRCKQPIIYRATPQWFLNMEHQNLRAKILTAIEEVQWLPPSSKERIKSMVELRPDWCLSRQRLWGAPIPILYCAQCKKKQCSQCNHINTASRLFDAIVAKIKQEGEDFWFDSQAPFLKDWGQDFPCPCCRSQELERESDILDVWMDSGVSWLALLANNDAMQYPADIYLEGTDQHRGWFQTSMITAVALSGQAPYKKVFTNGWVLDEKGRAMHKSLGNVVSPQEIVGQWGADILRLWAACTESLVDVRLSARLMEAHGENYKKIRNTIRYMLGNLFDFKPEKSGLTQLAAFEKLELYALAQLAKTTQSVLEAYGRFDFSQALRSLLAFSVHDLSTFYFDISKDRLYTFHADDGDRRAAQSVLFTILHYYLRLMAPVLPFTAEEAWQELLKICPPNSKELMLCGVKLNIAASVHETTLPIACADWKNEELDNEMLLIDQVRTVVNQKLDVLRKEGNLGSSLEAKVTILCAESKHHLLARWEAVLPSILIVSAVELKNNEQSVNDALAVAVDKAPGNKCQRCWVYHESVGDDKRDSQLCAKCINVLYG